MQATYYNDNQGEAEETPGMAGPLAMMGAWVGTGFLDSWLKKDKFLQNNPGLYNRARKTSGPARNKVFDQYYNKQYPKRNMRRKMPRSLWKSQARTSMMKKSASVITSRALGVANFLFLAPMLYGASYHGFKGIQRLGYELERPDMNAGSVALNGIAATDRQRAIRAMHDSEFNGRQSMGTEAFLYHR